MQSLVKHWPSCKKDMENKFMAVFLDYDGTLTPIAPTPGQAVLPVENKVLLQKLSKNNHCRIAVVSGRSLLDLKPKLAIKGIAYVGNHGLEIEGPDIHFKGLLPPQTKRLIEQIKNKLDLRLSSIKGVLLEDKELTLSLHYRLVEKKNVPTVKRRFITICEPYRRRGEIRIGLGKKVFEVRPPIKWNKGHAVSWLLRKYRLAEEKPVIPVYVGDDRTDEDAFAVIKNKGLTVLVGKRPSKARYYLNNTREVTWFLNELLQLSV